MRMTTEDFARRAGLVRAKYGDKLPPRVILCAKGPARPGEATSACAVCEEPLYVSPRARGAAPSAPTVCATCCNVLALMDKEPTVAVTLTEDGEQRRQPWMEALLRCPPVGGGGRSS